MLCVCVTVNPVDTNGGGPCAKLKKCKTNFRGAGLKRRQHRYFKGSSETIWQQTMRHNTTQLLATSGVRGGRASPAY